MYSSEYIYQTHEELLTVQINDIISLPKREANSKSSVPNSKFINALKKTSHQLSDTNYQTAAFRSSISKQNHRRRTSSRACCCKGKLW